MKQQIMLLGGSCEGWMMVAVDCSFYFGGTIDVGVPRWDLGHIHILENDQLWRWWWWSEHTAEGGKRERRKGQEVEGKKEKMGQCMVHQT